MKTSLRNVLKNFLLDYNEHISPPGLQFDFEFQKLKQLTEDLKKDPEYMCQCGLKDVNRPKNRYKDIVPYDRSRVILPKQEGVPGSDYINASYIKGASGACAYIAAQGPLPNTVLDFWRMVWSCDVCVIVMACSLSEGGKSKCEMYWPSKGEVMRYGAITVELVTVSEECEEFVVRTLLVRCGNAVRDVHQVQYLAWPDHEVPHSVDPLFRMVQLMRRLQASETVPVVVHCSAGCGRTGVICALDYVWSCLRQGKLSNNFSLYGIATELRRQRIAMIQTKEQYAWVHRAVAVLFTRQLEVIEHHTYANVDADGCIFADDCRTAPQSGVEKENEPVKDLFMENNHGIDLNILTIEHVPKQVVSLNNCLDSIPFIDEDEINHTNELFIHNVPTTIEHTPNNDIAKHSTSIEPSIRQSNIHSVNMTEQVNRQSDGQVSMKGHLEVYNSDHRSCSVPPTSGIKKWSTLPRRFSLQGEKDPAPKKTLASLRRGLSTLARSFSFRKRRNDTVVSKIEEPLKSMTSDQNTPPSAVPILKDVPNSTILETVSLSSTTQNVSKIAYNQMTPIAALPKSLAQTTSTKQKTITVSEKGLSAVVPEQHISLSSQEPLDKSLTEVGLECSPSLQKQNPSLNPKNTSTIIQTLPSRSLQELSVSIVPLKTRSSPSTAFGNSSLIPPLTIATYSPSNISHQSLSKPCQPKCPDEQLSVDTKAILVPSLNDIPQCLSKNQVLLEQGRSQWYDRSFSRTNSQSSQSSSEQNISPKDLSPKNKMNVFSIIRSPPNVLTLLKNISENQEEPASTFWYLDDSNKQGKPCTGVCSNELLIQGKKKECRSEFYVGALNDSGPVNANFETATCESKSCTHTIEAKTVCSEIKEDSRPALPPKLSAGQNKKNIEEYFPLDKEVISTTMSKIIANVGETSLIDADNTATLSVENEPMEEKSVYPDTCTENFNEDSKKIVIEDLNVYPTVQEQKTNNVDADTTLKPQSVASISPESTDSEPIGQRCIEQTIIPESTANASVPVLNAIQNLVSKESKQLGDLQFSCKSSTDSSLKENENHYANVSSFVQKNLVQIEEVLRRNVRGAIIDLTSRESYQCQCDQETGQKERVKAKGYEKIWPDEREPNNLDEVQSSVMQRNELRTQIEESLNLKVVSQSNLIEPHDEKSLQTKDNSAQGTEHDQIEVILPKDNECRSLCATRQLQKNKLERRQFREERFEEKRQLYIKDDQPHVILKTKLLDHGSPKEEEIVFHFPPPPSYPPPDSADTSESFDIVWKKDGMLVKEEIETQATEEVKSRVFPTPTPRKCKQTLQELQRSASYGKLFESRRKNYENVFQVIGTECMATSGKIPHSYENSTTLFISKPEEAKVGDSMAVSSSLEDFPGHIDGTLTKLSVHKKPSAKETSCKFDESSDPYLGASEVFPVSIYGKTSKLSLEKQNAKTDQWPDPQSRAEENSPVPIYGKISKIPLENKHAVIKLDVKMDQRPDGKSEVGKSSPGPIYGKISKIPLDSKRAKKHLSKSDQPELPKKSAVPVLPAVLENVPQYASSIPVPVNRTDFTTNTGTSQKRSPPVAPPRLRRQSIDSGSRKDSDRKL